MPSFNDSPIRRRLVHFSSAMKQRGSQGQAVRFPLPSPTLTIG